MVPQRQFILLKKSSEGCRMGKLSDLSSSLFDKSYPATIRVVMYDDVIHRKNKDFARNALKSSGFAKLIFDLLCHLPVDCCKQILGPDISGVESVDFFVNSFLKTQCRHFVNFHDERLCTVEFTCKFETNVETVLALPEYLVEKLHVEIKTPVGEVQL